MKREIKNFLLLIIILGGLFILTVPILAHPGRTAADGCHYCRTNCDSWGVPWNQRHCHGGSRYTPPSTYTPAEIPKEGNGGTIWWWIGGIGFIAFLVYIFKKNK